MFKIIYKEDESWFSEPIQAEEIIPADGWEVKEFKTYEEAEDFILALNAN